jgi:hypothetical protein
MRDWFKKHLNWTWFLFYLVTLIVTSAIVMYIDSLPQPTIVILTWENTTITTQRIVPHFAQTADGKWLDFIDTEKKEVPVQHSKIVVDEDAVRVRRYWGYPIYFIGVFIVSIWILKQKGRNLNWLWLTILLFVFTPMILSNKSEQRKEGDKNGVV